MSSSIVLLLAPSIFSPTLTSSPVFVQVKHPPQHEAATTMFHISCSEFRDLYTVSFLLQTVCCTKAKRFGQLCTHLTTAAHIFWWLSFLFFTNKNLKCVVHLYSAPLTLILFVAKSKDVEKSALVKGHQNWPNL
ncbi:hypothetical protein ATANTOWER_031630 [Ataeniobius toweri]|uniref:Secreted protein n=1 Tax=Ataeniobius toweri TaxID=208326 RepID=A0ABU7ACG8_9TELE|nr:hypothetical protein [Ataeniobius toweri]